MITDFKSKWQNIDDLENLRKVFIDHFFYLVDSPKFEKVLKEVSKKLTEVTFPENENALCFLFGEEEKMLVYPPLETVEGLSYPFAHLLEKHETIRLENSLVTLGDHGLFQDCFLDDLKEHVDSELYEVSQGEIEKIISPLSDYSDLWVYHPLEKNKSNLPKLYLLDHETGDIDEYTDFNIGALFISRLAYRLEIGVEDLVLVEVPEKETQEWWEQLPQEIAHYFEEEMDCNGTNRSITKLWVLEELSFPEDIVFANIDFLQPFKKLSDLSFKPSKTCNLKSLGFLGDLTKLNVSNSEITSLKDIKALTKLKSLNLSHTNVQEISEIVNFKKLSHLDLSNTSIADISSLSKLSALYELNLNQTNVTDLSSIKNLNKLWYLYVEGLQLKDFSVIKTLTSLNWLHMDRSNFSDFTLLVGTKINNIRCLEVPASFASCLTFIHSIKNTIPGFMMECDFDSPFNLLPELKKLDNDQTVYSKELFLFLYSALKWYHKPSYIEVVNQVLNEFCRFTLIQPEAYEKKIIRQSLKYYLEKAEIIDEKIISKYESILN